MWGLVTCVFPETGSLASNCHYGARKIRMANRNGATTLDFVKIVLGNDLMQSRAPVNSLLSTSELSKEIENEKLL